jgi:hypothetical protein
MVIFTVRRDGSVPLESVADQQVLLRERLAGAGWETPAILEAMPQAKTFYFDAVSQIQMRPGRAAGWRWSEMRWHVRRCSPARARR